MTTKSSLFVALLACTLLLGGCGSIQRAYDAALLLADMQAGNADSALKRRTDTPVVETLSYGAGGRVHVADRYQTAHARRGSLVLIHGFTGQGRRDPRLVVFAHSLARSGFRVLVPELPGLMNMTVGSAEREDIAAALRFATRDGAPIGLAAMSLAAGPALLAAMEADIAHRVGYVVLVGGYYDIADVIRYATTGVDGGSGSAREVPRPMSTGKWMLLLSQLHRLDHSDDRRILRAIAGLRMQDEHADVRPQVDALTGSGRAVYELITNTDPDRVEALIAALPAGVRAELVALNLSHRDLTALQARLLLIHGANDPVIPFSHSERLAATLPQSQVDLFVPPRLDHVDVGSGFPGDLHLWLAARRLLVFAEESRDSNMERSHAK